MAANEDVLSELHEKLASVMLEELEASEEAQILLDDYGDQIPDAVAVYLVAKIGSSSSPSLLTAVTKFLKDNDITCQPSASEDMSALEQILHKKPKSSVSNVETIDPTIN